MKKKIDLTIITKKGSAGLIGLDSLVTAELMEKLIFIDSIEAIILERVPENVTKQRSEEVNMDCVSEEVW